MLELSITLYSKIVCKVRCRILFQSSLLAERKHGRIISFIIMANE